MRHIRAIVLAGAIVAFGVAGATASAATKTVTMGLPTPAAAKAFNQRLGVDVNDYFPHKVVIAAGDSVRFVPRGFHTVDVPGPGEEGIPLFSPGAPISGANDAAGQPFWFNGQPQLGFTPSLQQSAFGERLTYDGSERVESGLPLADRPRPLVVRFDTPGRYTYVCDVHPGMEGVVVVKPRGAKVPSARQDARRVRKQLARDLAIARDLPDAKPPAGTVDVGEAGAHGVEYFGMLPAQAEVPVGGTIRFRMTPRSYEVHTATFGPGNPETEPNSYLGQMAASLESPSINPAALYPSDQPGQLVGLTATTHGNGFWNSGAMDAVAASPLPGESTLRFDAAGTYVYYCLIHPFMRGEIVVR